MVELIRMPEVLAGAREAAVQSWLVAHGDHVAIGQPLAELETDKAVVEYLSEQDGVIGRLLLDEGGSATVGDPIVALLSDGEGDADIDSALATAGFAPVADGRTPGADPTAASAATPTGADAERGTPPDPDPASAPRRLFASPLVRRLAAEHGVDPADIAGSGPHSRVVRRDLERHLAARQVTAAAAPARPEAAAPMRPEAAPAVPATDAGFVDVPVDRMRAAIARRLTESKSTVPHFYLVADCRVDELLRLRTRINELSERRVSINDLVVKALAGALREVPEANAVWRGDSIRRFAAVDIAVAVSIEGGLTTPVIRDVAGKALAAVSAEIADAAERARAGRLRQHELEGGSFSVSNLGMYGTAEFSAILNPPHAGILAVGAVRRVPVVGDDDTLGVGSVMTVTLSADHRVLDGALAARLLAAFQHRIENPLSTLL
ncbi:dihydrolipoamide acetyltransferase family protein [Microbacterium capsulatum]|uniref:Dihydrolipoamide acetyltransferase component of pyruvate dehydrogenase complex n=1 Tax=Microbacterium capsulatum TaxID=3041921 RepID=A0ABU0XLS5_9MICO|nr:dihydrolipoamide acetyltransferase family protein [Microbacterium sp. ASV81]MDQ4214685.1 dihydrolipoamide acetyltransferase family protein [Microbacterium sp. ASV81]